LQSRLLKAASTRRSFLRRTSLLLLLLEQPPRHARHNARDTHILVMACILGILAEEIHDILHAQFANCLTASLDRCICKFTLLGLQFEDALFNRVGDCEAVDYDVLSLVETMDTVDGLFFDELRKVSF